MHTIPVHLTKTQIAATAAFKGCTDMSPFGSRWGPLTYLGFVGERQPDGLWHGVHRFETPGDDDTVTIMDFGTLPGVFDESEAEDGV